MAAFNKFNAFTEHLAEKVHDLGADTLKVLLTLTAPVAANSVKADLTEIAAGNGYTAGGTQSTQSASSQSSGVYKLVSGDVVFTASGGAIANCRYAVLYNDTPTSPADPLIGWYDYGATLSILTGETLTIDFDGSNGVFTIT